MAAGDSKIFNDFPLKLGKKLYDLSTDGFSIAFIATAYGSVNADATNPDITDYTPLSGGNFSAATSLGTITFTRATTTLTFRYADLATIAKNASNPATIKTALVYHTVTGDLYKAVDLTADGGTTAIDVVNNDFDYTVNASGSFTQAVA